MKIDPRKLLIAGGVFFAIALIDLLTKNCGDMINYWPCLSIIGKVSICGFLVILAYFVIRYIGAMVINLFKK